MEVDSDDLNSSPARGENFFDRRVFRKRRWEKGKCIDGTVKTGSAKEVRGEWRTSRPLYHLVPIEPIDLVCSRYSFDNTSQFPFDRTSHLGSTGTSAVGRTYYPPDWHLIVELLAQICLTGDLETRRIL